MLCNLLGRLQQTRMIRKPRLNCRLSLMNGVRNWTLFVPLLINWSILGQWLRHLSSKQSHLMINNFSPNRYCMMCSIGVRLTVGRLVCRSVDPSIDRYDPSIHLFNHPSNHLSTYLSTHPPIHVLTHSLIHPPIHPSNQLPTNQPAEHPPIQ